jgi:uncharacterized protein YcsI (UPF0317 family)
MHSHGIDGKCPPWNISFPIGYFKPDQDQRTPKSRIERYESSASSPLVGEPGSRGSVRVSRAFLSARHRCILVMKVRASSSFRAVSQRGRGVAQDYGQMHPREVRARFRGGWVSTCTGKSLGFVQAVVAIVPASHAYDFLLFCQRNPKPCTPLEVTDAGDPILRLCAPGADIRTDLPRYRVYRDGVVIDEPTDIRRYWTDDLVAFIMAGSFTWEAALIRNGVPLRQLEAGFTDDPIYITNQQCTPAGSFQGPLVVGMRPIPGSMVARAVQVSARFPRAHGAPVNVGAPELLGIADVAHPDFGDPPIFQPGDVPVWATTVTFSPSPKPPSYPR